MYFTYQIGKRIAHVDAAFMDLISLPGWRLSDGYIRHKCGVFLHRLIASADDGQIVDHIDGNPLNNEKSNLRICSHDENMRNRKRHANNQSGAKGVYQERSTKRWRAQIRANGKKYSLGTFGSIEQAQAAYVLAAKNMHGKFARLV